MLLRYFSHRTSSRGHLQGRGCRQRPLPPNVCGAAVIPVEGAPPVLLPPAPRHVAVFREGDAAGDPPPNIYSAAVVWGESAPPVHLPCNLISRPSSGTETPPAILPPIVTAWRSSAGRMLLRYLSGRTSSRGHLQGGECWRRSAGRRVHLRHSPRRPLSRGFCPGGRRRVRSYP